MLPGLGRGAGTPGGDGHALAAVVPRFGGEPRWLGEGVLHRGLPDEIISSETTLVQLQ
jgi:hypothetical protein